MVWKRFSDGGECKWWLVNKLQKRGYEVRPDWIPFTEKETEEDWSHYCPRVDIAVGPFDTVGGSEEILKAAEKDALTCFLKERTDDVNLHPNCLVAIEIGYTGTRKHRMGDLVNASLVGHVGIMVAKDDRTEQCYQRIQEYMDYYNKHHASPFGLCANVLVMTVDAAADMLASLKK